MALPDHQNRRYLSLLDVNEQLDICKPLETTIDTDYLVIGGGVAGLHAAQALIEKKCKVVLIEKNICGGGMSGRSGGFLTPDSELGLRQIEKKLGSVIAEKIWKFGESGQHAIVRNIKDHQLNCDLRDQDSLLLGLGTHGQKVVKREYDDRNLFGLPSELINKRELRKHNTGSCYTAGVRYTDCYAINPMQYCQELKLHLMKQGVQVFEFSHIYKLEQHRATTNLGEITFKHAVVCPGKAETEIFKQHSKHTYGILNYITISEPLSSAQIQAMMPSGECMCRDTQLVFTYYRLTGDKRIVLGGGNVVGGFQPRDVLQPWTIQSVIHDFKKMFPCLHEVVFPQYRSGRIQASKDLMPLVGRSKRRANHVRVQGAVGLPRAARCGRFATQILHDEADRDLMSVYRYDRPFFLPILTNNRILKPLIFGLNNAKVMFV